MPMCIKEMQMPWIVSCLLLTLKQLTCIYYSYLSEAFFTLYFYLRLLKSVLFKWIKLEGHHIVSRHIQKNSPLTNKYQETLTSYNSEMFLSPSLHLVREFLGERSLEQKSFLLFGNPVQDRLTHAATDAWGHLEQHGLMFNHTLLPRLYGRVIQHPTTGTTEYSRRTVPCEVKKKKNVFLNSSPCRLVSVMNK